MKKRIGMTLFLVIGLVQLSLLYADTLLEEHTLFENTNGACAIAAADFNLDGFQDLVYTCFQSGHITWLENDGNLNFSEHLVINGYTNAKAIDVGDINQDGYPDFVATANGADRITWFENNHDETFTAHDVATTWDEPGFVQVTDRPSGNLIDINSDGEVDILATACQIGRIGWFENDGEENFEEHIIKDDWTVVSGAVALDVDGDTDIDIIAAAQGGGVVWFENIGDDEVFTEHLLFDGWDKSNWIQAGFINDDTYVDFALTSCGISDNVGWFENDGSQNFTLHMLNDSYAGGRSPVLSDIDEDGDTDIFAIAWQDAVASFFENDGEANFTETFISTDALDLLKLFIVDLDSDDDLDIVGCTAVYGVHHIRWWENVNEFLVADFTVDVVTGNVPLSVNFSESTFSKPPVQYWHWDFDNDGIIDSYEQNPEWTYNEVGSYMPTLVVSNGVITETVTLDDSIRVFDGESALYFESGNCVMVSPSPTLNIIDDLTMEAWIKPIGWGLHPSLGFGRIIDKTAYVLMLIKEYAVTNNYCLAMWLYNENGTNSIITTPDSSISLDTWQHVAASFSNTYDEVKMYINGIEQELSFTNTPSGPIADNSASDLAIGSTNYNCFTFNGTIDEVRVWNDSRSSDDIQYYRNYYLSGSEPGLSGYWQMNEGNGILVHDSSPNFNDGVILDPVWTHGKGLLPVGIDEIIENEELYSQILPNPCRKNLNISFFCKKSENIKINIYNIRGQRVKTLAD
ncbi:MAG: VCBS repeat-containing protein, partial [Candidatus Cloacimonetes bacterium]|nr:VCBS repeat-containing protein [Candidatus Cloacimonadota bacterium]